MTKEEKQRLVDSVPFWWHSIDLGDGVVTPGRKTPEIHQQELEWMQLPNLHDKSVLDIGAWDGFYSFEAERRNAHRVLALDHYVWSIDYVHQLERIKNWNGTRSRFVPFQLAPATWQPHSLPGKRGFDTAHLLLNSRVEQCVNDFMTMPLEKIGGWDVTFFLGVLYHLTDPLGSLRRLSTVTRELAIIETAAIYDREREDRELLEFYESFELADDPTNWFAPNLKALQGMCRAAGFKTIEPTSPYPPTQADAFTQYRLTVHARH